MEEPNFTANKRYMQTHYSYRDHHTVATLVFVGGELQESGAILAALAAGTPLENLTTMVYRFGDNARANWMMNTMYQTYGVNEAYHLWPRVGDRIRQGASGLEPIITTTYARDVVVHCDQNAWIKFVSINPEYIRQSLLASFKALPQTVAPQLLFEQEQYIPANTLCRFFLTFGYAVIFRANTVGGTMRFWCEGNMEGTE